MRRAICLFLLLVATPLVAVQAEDPLLLRVAKGSDDSLSTPVWMMRQAGRHMTAYRELVKSHPTFRERSETPELSLQISLQPVQACECQSTKRINIHHHHTLTQHNHPIDGVNQWIHFVFGYPDTLAGHGN